MKAETLGNKSTHPCFDFDARHRYARVHLPVAAKCNIKCKFCDRRYSCLNENRPGVSTEVLSPRQALAYFDMLTKRLKNISVVGIAGPGDAFATPGKTVETLRLIRGKYPSMQFCVATNGFNVWPYIGILKNVGVTHMTITVNAVDPEIGEKIYAWAREGRTIYRGRKAAEILIERQLAVVKALGKEGIAVKVNTVLIPGVNDEHVVDIAKKAGSLGAYTFNAMPLYPLAGTEFEDIEAPTAKALSAIREQCGKYLRQMAHCQRCRADAAGMLNEPMSDDLKNSL
ncbi:MAG: radical SAM protein, partial [FCB group bacterium]|nr:radical SAM protein [FCB group bacterium]